MSFEDIEFWGSVIVMAGFLAYNWLSKFIDRISEEMEGARSKRGAESSAPSAGRASPPRTNRKIGGHSVFGKAPEGRRAGSESPFGIPVEPSFADISGGAPAPVSDSESADGCAEQPAPGEPAPPVWSPSGDLCGMCYAEHQPSGRFSEILSNRDSLASAVALSEILGRPVSLRGPNDKPFL